MKTKLSFILFLLCSILSLHSQYRSPLDIPLFLSGNFGELRNNHFHSGLDFKTQAVENKPVYAIADGFVSRISVSPAGYGLVIYVDHPATGHRSVYAHLNGYAPKIAKYVEQQQYAQERFRVDLTIDNKQLSVKKGEVIAYSGNTGSSAGAHVHFEIRDVNTEALLDPLQFYKGQIKDAVAPEIRGISVYPILDKGVVNGSINPLRQGLAKTKKGVVKALAPIQAWGTIGLGVKAYDRMTGTSNVYGVKLVRLLMDEKEISKSDIVSFGFDQTRMLNSFIDFADWRLRKSFFMKSFVEAGNTLPFYRALNNGYITIDKEKVYNFRYELEDIYGNTSTYSFSIEGKKQLIPQHPKSSLYMAWDKDNRYLTEEFSLFVSKGNLYSDFCFKMDRTVTKAYYSNRFQLNNSPVPLHKNADVKIKLQTDTLLNKKQYGIVLLNKNSESWIGGTYANGFITASIRELGGEYAVSSDTESPVITPLAPINWEKTGAIRITLTDNKSGIESFKGTVDGKFVLFTHDVKSTVYTYKMDPQRLVKGQTHQLIFTATDGCGNTTEYSAEFYY